MHDKPLDPEILKRIRAMTGEADPDGDSTDARQRAAEHGEETAPENDAARLRSLFARLNDGRERSLKPGMLAVWKPGLKNKRLPAYGQPAVVMEVMKEPVLDHTEEAGSPYFREPIGLLLGVLMEGTDFWVWHFDARRFQPVSD